MKQVVLYRLGQDFELFIDEKYARNEQQKAAIEFLLVFCLFVFVLGALKHVANSDTGYIDRGFYMVCLSVCLSITTVIHAKTADQEAAWRDDLGGPK